MEGLQLVQFHHQLQISQMSIAPISSLSCNLNSIISKYFSTFRPKLSTSTSSSSRIGKIEAVTRVSAVELKEQWLNSLSCCPPLITQMEDQMLLQDKVEVGGCGNGEGNIGSSEFVIGIDPDVSGALAVLKNDDGSAQVYDSPNVKVLVGNRVRRRLDTKAMVQLLRSLNIPNGTTAYIEQSLPFPADGKQGWWSGGFNYGLWIGVLVASEVSVIPVPSMRWKQEFKLCGNGSTKDDSRALACTLFPTLSSSLRRKKDHGRAEALLIAAYGKGIKLNSESLSSIDTETTT